MKKVKNFETNLFFRKAVISAILEQIKVDPDPLIKIKNKLKLLRPAFGKINWLSSEKSLEIFHELLKNEKYIYCDFASFKSHFYEETRSIIKIMWQGNICELVYIFNRLREQGIIQPIRYQHKLLALNFNDKYNKPLNPNTLRSLLNKGFGEVSERVSIIENIIDKVLKYS